MTEQTGFPPDPAANRAEYLASHPGAQPVGQGQAAEQVAATIGAGAPSAGVSDAELGAQMAAAGATAGLPAEDAQNEEMARLRAMVENIGAELALVQQQRQAERQAAIAALGEPILQRYANGVRDKLKAHLAANPGLGPDHYGPVIADAEKLSEASARAISRGANDMGEVLSVASRLDRFFSKGHARTAPSHLAAVDHSSAVYDLEQVINEAGKLSGQLVPV